MGLSSRDLWRLLEAAEILHAHAEGRFRERLEAATRLVFPAEFFALDVFGHDGSHLVETDIPFDAQLLDIIREHGAELIKRDHPVALDALIGSAKPQRLSDTDPSSRLLDTELGRLLYRPFDIRYQLMAPVRMLGGQGVLTLDRDRKDFTERELLLAAQLARHVELAFATNRLLENSSVDEGSEDAMYERLAQRRITRRECSVLFWLVQGKRNLEIALILSISPRTVEIHLTKAYRKLGVESRTSALAAIARLSA